MVTIDANDLFQVMARTPGSVFSAIRVAADELEEFCMANLCLKLFDRLNAQPYQICKSGDIMMRITSPAASKITLGEIEMICESVRRFSSGNLIWGLDSDNTIETINVDLIFEISI